MQDGVKSTDAVAEEFLGAEAKQWLAIQHPWVFEFEATESSRHRRDDIDDIIGSAMRTDSEAVHARHALAYILITAHKRANNDEQLWLQSLLSETVADICEHDKFARQELCNLVIYCLCEHHQLSKQARIAMLRALLALSRSGDGELPALNYFETADVLLRALEKDMERKRSDQDESFQLQTIEQLKQFRHAQLLPVLQAMTKAHWSSKVKQAAGDMIFQLNDSILQIWDQTVPDTASDAQTQAKRLREVVNEGASSMQTVQGIFNATKGATVVASDPRLPYLKFALGDQDEKIRLCAARVLLDSAIAEPEWNEVIGTVADLAINAKNLGSSRDALDMLAYAEQTYTGKSNAIIAAKEAASRKFITRYGG